MIIYQFHTHTRIVLKSFYSPVKLSGTLLYHSNILREITNTNERKSCIRSINYKREIKIVRFLKVHISRKKISVTRGRMGMMEKCNRNSHDHFLCHHDSKRNGHATSSRSGTTSSLRNQTIHLKTRVCILMIIPRVLL